MDGGGAGGVPVPGGGKADSFRARQETAKKKQTGELPPDVDQDGKMINPHNPDFITKVPWYLGNSGPTLRHHSVQKSNAVLSMAETDALVQQKAQRNATAERALVFRKGACKNCGSMTHNEKQCVERPRSSKKAAWKSGLDIAKDEATVNLTEYGKVTYDAKRDQWSGYSADDYQAEVVNKYERLEAERRRKKAEEKAAQQREKEQRQQARRAKRKEAALKAAAEGAAKPESGSSSSEASSSESGSDYESDEADSNAEDDATDFIERDESARDFQGRQARQGGVGGAQMKTTVRNLRIREDTPKYLRNLDLNSAFYDPKTRSMRMNPFPDENPEDLVYAGDNFVRHTGDAAKLAASELLCWEMQARGENVDVISNPSQAELLKKEFTEKKKVVEEEKRRAIFDKYGVDMPSSDAGVRTDKLDPRLILGQTEAYVEYSADGRVIKGAGATGASVKARTKYEEDVCINNHTAVWGSYFNRSRMAWGFACCHSLIKNSYCTGGKGREANDNEGSQALGAEQAQKMLASVSGSSSGAAARSTEMVKRSDVYGEFDSSSKIKLSESKVKEALQRMDASADNGSSSSSNADSKKRSYNSMQSAEVTPEDMEAYRLRKAKFEDPMAAILASDEVLEYK